MATGGINVQVTIDAQDRGAAQKLLDLKRAAGELGVAFNQLGINIELVDLAFDCFFICES